MKNWIIVICGAAVAAGLPLAHDNYLLRVGTNLAMYVVLAQSWNFIGGLAGYPSFATAAFFGLGAYASAVLQTKGIPMLVGWSAGAFAAALFAAIIGGAILHLRGHYFAIASLVIAEVLRETINSTPDITGGGMGLNLPIMRLSVDTQAMFFFYAMLGLAVATVATAVVIQRSRLGFGLRCIEQSEEAANVLGVNAYAYKTYAFVLSAVYVGVAGAIYASWVRYIEPPDVFDVLLSIKPVVMVLLGGLGSLFGPVVGAFLIVVFEEVVWRNFLNAHQSILGIIIVLLVFFMPGGLLAFVCGKLRREKALA
jgi:branched-chain amino acid transport system permease protein